MNYRSFLSEAAKSQNMIMAKNLNEDQKTDLIQEINGKLQNLSVDLLKEILSSFKTKEEKKFSGEIGIIISGNGRPASADYVFDNVRGLIARLAHIDPNNRKRVGNLLVDYALSKGYYKAKFVQSSEDCDVYNIFNKSGGPFSVATVFLYKKIVRRTIISPEHWDKLYSE